MSLAVHLPLALPSHRAPLYCTPIICFLYFSFSAPTCIVMSLKICFSVIICRRIRYSNVARKTICPEKWLSLCTECTVPTKSCTICTVERPLPDPYCLAERSPASEIAVSNRGFSSFSRRFPVVLSIHSGQYAPGQFGSPLLLLISGSFRPSCLPTVLQAF